MPDFLLMSIEYGGYVSIVKLIVYLLLYFLWFLLVTWAAKDAKAVETNVGLWVGLLLGAGAVGILLWWLIPIFIVGLLVYIITVGATAMAFVKHRNARVLDFDRVLTVDHIKSIFSTSEKLEAMEGFMFITANNNEVPPPEPRTPTFFGYRTAYEILSDAKYRRASTIAFAPKGDTYEVTHNIDGVPTKQPAIPRDQMEYFRARPRASRFDSSTFPNPRSCGWRTWG